MLTVYGLCLQFLDMKTIKQLLVLLLVSHQVHLGHGGVSRFLYEVKINKQPNPESGKRKKIKLIFYLNFIYRR